MRYHYQGWKFSVTLLVNMVFFFIDLIINCYCQCTTLYLIFLCYVKLTHLCWSFFSWKQSKNKQDPNLNSAEVVIEDGENKETCSNARTTAQSAS